MKPAYISPAVCALLMLVCTAANAQATSAAPRAPAAPTDSSVRVPRPVANGSESDTSRGDKATDPDAPTASHDEVTGRDQPAPSPVQAPNAVVSHPDFKTLDVNNRGYLTSDDVAHSPWLTSNFARCDANHDGRLSQQEFANCK